MKRLINLRPTRGTAVLLGVLPFVLAAGFVGPFMRLMGRFRRHLGKVEKVLKMAVAAHTTSEDAEDLEPVRIGERPEQLDSLFKRYCIKIC